MKLFKRLCALTLCASLVMGAEIVRADMGGTPTIGEKYSALLAEIGHSNVPHFKGPVYYSNDSLYYDYYDKGLDWVEALDMDNDGFNEMIAANSSDELLGSIGIVTSDNGYVHTMYLDDLINMDTSQYFYYSIENCGISVTEWGKFLIVSGEKAYYDFTIRTNWWNVYIKQGQSMVPVYKLEQEKIPDSAAIEYRYVYKNNGTVITEGEFNYFAGKVMHLDGNGEWSANKIPNMQKETAVYNVGNGKTVTVRAYDSAIASAIANDGDFPIFSSYYDILSYVGEYSEIAIASVKFADMDGDGIREMILICEDDYEMAALIYTISDGVVFSIGVIDSISPGATFGISEKNGKKYFVVCENSVVDDKNCTSSCIYEKTGNSINAAAGIVSKDFHGIYKEYESIINPEGKYEYNGFGEFDISAEEYNSIASKYLSNNGGYYGFNETIQPFSPTELNAFIERVRTNNY